MKQTALTLLIFLYFFALRGSTSDRVRRHLLFNRGSRLFLAVDVRDNFFSHSSVFAQAVGFKLSWNLPDRIAESTRDVRIHRRALKEGLNNLLNMYNNGNSCLEKFTIEWNEASRKWGPNRVFVARLLELIIGSDDKLKRFTETERQRISNECPLTFVSSEFV